MCRRILSALATIALATIAFSGCGRAQNALSVENLPPAEMMAAQLLLPRPEVRVVVGDHAVINESTVGSGDLSSRIPIITDLSGAGRRDWISRSFLVRGEKGEGVLTVQLRRKGSRPWKLEDWGIITKQEYDQRGPAALTQTTIAR
jgi:hypothetical protein